MVSVNEPIDEVESVVFVETAMVGEGVVLQTNPRTIIGEPPSEITLA